MHRYKTVILITVVLSSIFMWKANAFYFRTTDDLKELSSELKVLSQSSLQQTSMLRSYNQKIDDKEHQLSDIEAELNNIDDRLADLEERIDAYLVLNYMAVNP